MVARAGRHSPPRHVNCKQKSGGNRVAAPPRALQLLLLALTLLFASQTLRSGDSQGPAAALPGQALRAAGAAVGGARDDLNSIDEATELFRRFIEGPTRPQLEKFWRRRLQGLPQRGIAVAAGARTQLAAWPLHALCWAILLELNSPQNGWGCLRGRRAWRGGCRHSAAAHSAPLTHSPLAHHRAGSPRTLANAFTSLYVLRRSLGCQLPITLM